MPSINLLARRKTDRSPPATASPMAPHSARCSAGPDAAEQFAGITTRPSWDRPHTSMHGHCCAPGRTTPPRRHCASWCAAIPPIPARRPSRSTSWPIWLLTPVASIRRAATSFAWRRSTRRARSARAPFSTPRSSRWYAAIPTSLRASFLAPSRRGAVTGEVDASHYWLARARLAMGDTAAAHAGFRELVARGPDSYYAVRAAARLDTMPWPSFNAVPPIPPDSLDGIFDRARRLELLGLDMEAKFERDRVAAEAKGIDAERVGEAFSRSRPDLPRDPAGTARRKCGCTARFHPLAIALSAAIRGHALRCCRAGTPRSLAGGVRHPPGVGFRSARHVAHQRAWPDAGRAQRWEGARPDPALPRLRPGATLASASEPHLRHLPLCRQPDPLPRTRTRRCRV